VADDTAGQPDQLVQRRREDAMRVAGGGVETGEASETGIDCRGQPGSVGEGRNTADGESGGAADAVGGGTLGLADEAEGRGQGIGSAAPVAGDEGDDRLVGDGEDEGLDDRPRPARRGPGPRPLRFGR
jgi:hypothetical protein